MNVRGVAAAYGASLLNVISSALANLWLFGVVAREFDKPTVGLFVFVSTTASYLGLLQLSLDFAAGQRIAAALGAGDEAGAARRYRQVVTINRVLAGVIAGLIGVAVLVVLARATDSAAARLTATLVALTGASQVVGCLARGTVAGLTGAQQIATIQVVKVAGSVASTFAAYALIRGGFGIASLALADLGMQAGIGAVLTVVLIRRCPWASVAVPDVTAGLGEMIRYGASVSLASLANFACANVDPYLLRLTDSPFERIAEYAVWARFPLQFASMNWMLFAATSPAYAAAAATAGPDAARRTFRYVAMAFVAVGLAGLVGLAAWLTPFVHAWMDGRYDRPEGPLLALALAAGIAVKNVLAGLTIPFYATARLRPVVAAYAGIFVVKCLLGIVFVPRTPLVGLATAEAAGSVAATVFIASLLVRAGNWPGRDAALAVAGVLLVAATGGLAGMRTRDWEIGETAVGIGLTGLGLAAVAGLALWNLKRRRTNP